jgi:hypothetical protein
MVLQLNVMLLQLQTYIPYTPNIQQNNRPGFND